MNLAQIRTVVRDALTAGGGQNTVVSIDTFWSDGEINHLINEAQRELWKIVRRARSDFFVRLMRTTDSPLMILGQVFDPSTLRWAAGQGNYTLPPDFTRMKLMTDLSTDRVRIMFSDIARNEFKVLMNQEGGSTAREYLADILGLRTLMIRPIPQDVRDLEFIYERMLPILRDWTTGVVSVLNGNTTMTFSAAADIVNRLEPGDEVIVGSGVADPLVNYPMIRSIDSTTQVTLMAPYLGVDAANSAYRASSVSHIPIAHHDLLGVYAVKEAFKKGTNPHSDAVALWTEKWNSMIPSLVTDIEVRQGQDTEYVQAYLEDLYDA